MATEEKIRAQIRGIIRREYERQEFGEGEEKVRQAFALRDFVQGRIHPRIRKEAMIAGGFYKIELLALKTGYHYEERSVRSILSP